MVFGAFVILNLLRETGAIEDVKATIARISDDRRVQAVRHRHDAPDLPRGRGRRGRSRRPSRRRSSWRWALIPSRPSPWRCWATRRPASWGGAGLTTINGGAALVDAGVSTVSLNSAMVGRIPHVRRADHSVLDGRHGRSAKRASRGAVPYLAFTGIYHLRR